MLGLPHVLGNAEERKIGSRKQLSYLSDPWEWSSTKQRDDMKKLEELQQDIDTLRESISLQWKEIGTMSPNQQDTLAARAAIECLVSDLKYLLEQKDDEKANARKH